MYKKESVINGVLGFQSTPNGVWTPYTAEQLTEKLLELRSEYNELLSENCDLRDRH